MLEPNQSEHLQKAELQADTMLLTCGIAVNSPTADICLVLTGMLCTAQLQISAYAVYQQTCCAEGEAQAFMTPAPDAARFAGAAPGNVDSLEARIWAQVHQVCSPSRKGRLSTLVKVPLHTLPSCGHCLLAGCSHIKGTIKEFVITRVSVVPLVKYRHGFRVVASTLVRHHVYASLPGAAVTGQYIQ